MTEPCPARPLWRWQEDKKTLTKECAFFLFDKGDSSYWRPACWTCCQWLAHRLLCYFVFRLTKWCLCICIWGWVCAGARGGQQRALDPPGARAIAGNEPSDAGAGNQTLVLLSTRWSLQSLKPTIRYQWGHMIVWIFRCHRTLGSCRGCRNETSVLRRPFLYADHILDIFRGTKKTRDLI